MLDPSKYRVLKTKLRLFYLIVLILAFQSCKENIKGKDEKQIEKVETDDTVQRSLSSQLRQIDPGKVYTDTVEFINANYDYDYWFINTIKKGDTVSFIIDKEYDFRHGEKLEISWKIDSIWIAGDGERLDFAEWLVSVKRLHSTNLPQSLPLKQFPVTDSTSFDQLEALKIADQNFPGSIKSQLEGTDKKNFSLNYSLPFSNHFTTVVITYQNGDHELFTTLLTLDRNNKIINTLDIAYDEIAESAFRKISVINRENIEVTSWNYMSEVPEKTIERYKVKSDGTIQQVTSP